MQSKGARRALVERLIVAELISRRGEGPLARRYYSVARSPRDDAEAEPGLPVGAPEEPR